MQRCFSAQSGMRKRVHDEAMSSKRKATALPKADHHGNILINRLSCAERERFLAQCDDVELAVDDLLVDIGQRRRHVHFPQSGMIVLLAEVHGHAALEVALIGREAMDGAMLVFGETRASTRSVVLAKGRAWRMSVRQFRVELAASQAISRLVDRAANHLFSQVAQAVPCTRFHPLLSRLALWLLRAQDRMGSSDLCFTHQRLAELLGVQRSAVTLAAGHLHRSGFIRYARGDLQILDRSGLEASACACYAITSGDPPAASRRARDEGQRVGRPC